MDAPSAFVIVISAGCARRAMRFNLRGVDRICSSCRQIDPVDGSPSAQEKSSAVFFFFVLLPASLFFGSGNHFLLSCIASAMFFAVQRTQHVIATVSLSPQLQPAKCQDAAGRDRREKKNPRAFLRHAIPFPVLPDGTQPRVHARRRNLATGGAAGRARFRRRKKEKTSSPDYSFVPPTLAIKGKERREENRCTTRLRLVGVCDRQRRGNKLVGAARASAILSTLASFLHPCALRRKGTGENFGKKKKREGP